jgi:hypothetical protein
MANSVPAQRRALRAEINQRRKAVLPKLKAAVKLAQSDRKKRLRSCQVDCKAATKKARQRATVAKRKLEQAIKRARKRAAETCKSCKVIDTRGLDEISRSLEALDKERQEIDRLRAQASMMISERGRKGGRRAAELRSESDDEVVRNLGEDKPLIELFKKHRAKIKASKHRSRTEAFLEFVHDHPEELDELRSKREIEWGQKAEKMFRERQPDENGNSCWDDLEKCRRELAELKAAEKFLSEAEVPF